jgi:hypothetical protein
MKESGTMKLKKWLSRALVLAMVVALMIPVPVAAKSSGGGKLVKSVTYYSPQEAGGWQVTGKTTYTYGKKGMPTAITDTTYNSYFLGVPVGGESETRTVKYKGKTAKYYDSAGFIQGKATFKGGKTVTYSWNDKTSDKVMKDGKWIDFATFTSYTGHYSYFKNGLAKASDSTYTYQNSDNDSEAVVTNSVYAWTQKKGVPSAVVATFVRNAVYNGKPDEDNGKAESSYAVFNSKGLTIESGEIVDGKNVPSYSIQYTMKKGKVDTAVVYSIDSKGVPTPARMYKFKYAKGSVSKAKYFNMMNSLIGHTTGVFDWY